MVVYLGTDYIGQIITGLTTNITGSLFLTLLMIAILLTLITTALRIPIIFTAIILLPIFLTSSAMDGGFIPTLGATLLYLGFAMATLIKPQ